MQTTSSQGLPGLGAETRQPGQEQGLARVVVATDFSPRAERALARVAHLPLSPGAQVHVLHVLDPLTEDDPLAAREREVVERDLEDTAHSLARRVRHRGPVDVRPVLRLGEPIEQVAKLAEDSGAELVVMGRPHSPAALWGREAAFRPERLLRRMKASLLVVAPQEVQPYHQPLAAVDFSPLSRQALELTLRVCPRARWVEVVHVCDTSYTLVLHQAGASPERLLHFQRGVWAEAREALVRFLEGLEGPLPALKPRVLSGERAESILDAAREQQADLIALGARSVGFAESLLRTLAGGILRGALCDVLIVREAHKR
jgi:nucleotide-binding universal stress UspA family protein